jgi:hypothetical protein
MTGIIELASCLEQPCHVCRARALEARKKLCGMIIRLDMENYLLPFTPSLAEENDRATFLDCIYTSISMSMDKHSR